MKPLLPLNKLLRVLLAVLLPICICRSYAQCTGSLGAPIVNETFGAGTNPGPPLSPGITDMQYITGCPEDGQYTIVNYTTDCNGGWHTITDHTGDPNGYFMLINASFSPSTFFTQTINGLCEGNTYEFSAWIINTDSVTSGTIILGNVTFNIETTTGTLLQSYSTGDIPLTVQPTWVKYGFYFQTPPGSSSVVISMYNNAPGGNGNDLGLDDIQFRAVGPPANAQIAGTAGVTSTSIDSCEKAALSVQVSGNCYSNPAYQWQVSTDSINWTNIANATSTAYTAPPASPGVYYYRAEVAQEGNIGNASCSVFSNIVTVTVSKSCKSMPVSLLNFTAAFISNSVQLQWQTTREINSNYFSIQRSNDGVSFSEIGKVNAAGNSNSLQQYSFIDNNPLSVNYYRLKEVDLNGSVTYSKILQIKLPTANTFTILQDPVQNNLQLQINVSKSQTNTLSVFDFSGRRLKTFNVQNGVQDIDVSFLTLGTYLLQLIARDGEEWSKVFVKR